MHFSIQVIVGTVILLLFLASAISLYFALGNLYTIPLVLIALINTEAVMFLIFLITRGIIRPLNSIRAVVKRVGEGDFIVRIKISSTKEMTELGQSLNEMIAKLQDARAHEKEVERLKTEFVSLAAHQLRTPLSSIKWTLQAFLEGDLGFLTDEQKEFISRTYTSNEKMISLINDLLNLTRIEEGRYLYRPLPVQLKDVVESIVEWYKEEAKRRGITFVLEYAGKDFPKVLVDEEKIRLALQNLIDNALRYTREGGRVTVFLKRDTENIEISVQDTGIGVPDDQKQRIFERFFRAENARKVDTQGLGLGLYLAKNIVEAHGGKIWFESEENKGATFTFSIPITQ